jgi:hypothetical protein
MQNVNDAIDSDAPSPLAPMQTPADKERQQCDVNANTDIELASISDRLPTVPSGWFPLSNLASREHRDAEGAPRTDS